MMMRELVELGKQNFQERNQSQKYILRKNYQATMSEIFLFLGFTSLHKTRLNFDNKRFSLILNFQFFFH